MKRLFSPLHVPAHLRQSRDRHWNVRHCDFAEKESGDRERLRAENANAPLAQVLNPPLNFPRSGVSGANRRHAPRAHFERLRKSRILTSLSLGRTLHSVGSCRKPHA